MTADQELTASTEPVSDADLRRLAEQATPGPWRVAALTPPLSVYPDPSTHPGVGTVPAIAYEIRGTNNAAYIAAANPQAILALLNERDEYAAKLGEQIGVPSAAERRVAALEAGLRALVEAYEHLDADAGLAAMDAARALLDPDWKWEGSNTERITSLDPAAPPADTGRTWISGRWERPVSEASDE